MSRLLTEQDIAKWLDRLEVFLAGQDNRQPVLLTDPWGDTTYEGYVYRRPFTPAKVAS